MFQADDRLIKKARGTDKLKKIAVIHDLSGMGKCSLTAAIPVISSMGVQACPLPTAVLSNQTGYGSYFWDDYTDRMELIMDEWKKTGFTPDGVYTGFLGDYAYEADTWMPNLDKEEHWSMVEKGEERYCFDLIYHFTTYKNETPALH